MKRILIFGNSGSGKSTVASRLANEHSIPHLDLDTVSWSSPGVRKSLPDSIKAVNDFINSNNGWVIEGCYGSLIEAAAVHCSEMHFLNPGIETCLRNNLQRQWEPHKYDSKEAQDKNLEMLQNWVREYASRNDEYSLMYHKKVFDKFNGSKVEHLTIADL